MKNTGTVMCEWMFVPKNDELLVCKPWLRLTPREGILAPDETAEIEVSIDLRNEEKALSIMSNHGYVSRLWWVYITFDVLIYMNAVLSIFFS